MDKQLKKIADNVLLSARVALIEKIILKSDADINSYCSLLRDAVQNLGLLEQEHLGLLDKSQLLDFLLKDIDKLEAGLKKN